MDKQFQILPKTDKGWPIYCSITELPVAIFESREDAEEYVWFRNKLQADLRKLVDELRELSNKKNIRSPWTTERLKGIAKGQSDCADKIDKLLEGKGE